MISQNEADYFFDSLRQVTDWTRKNRPGKEGMGMDGLILCMEVMLSGKTLSAKCFCAMYHCKKMVKYLFLGRETGFQN